MAPKAKTTRLTTSLVVGTGMHEFYYSMNERTRAFAVHEALTMYYQLKTGQAVQVAIIAPQPAPQVAVVAAPPAVVHPVIEPVEEPSAPPAAAILAAEAEEEPEELVDEAPIVSSSLLSDFY